MTLKKTPQWYRIRWKKRNNYKVKWQSVYYSVLQSVKKSSYYCAISLLLICICFSCYYITVEKKHELGYLWHVYSSFWYQHFFWYEVYWSCVEICWHFTTWLSALWPWVRIQPIAACGVYLWPVLAQKLDLHFERKRKTSLCENSPFIDFKALHRWSLLMYILWLKLLFKILDIMRMRI